MTNSKLTELLAGTEGHHFSSGPEYLADFEREAGQLQGAVLWKWECRQTFREPGDPSWEALDRGDLVGALRMLDETKDETINAVAACPYRLRRVRVAQQPLSDYLRWELHALSQQIEGGEEVRVLDATPASHRSLSDGPEVIAFENGPAYEIIYDSTGTLIGGRKITDSESVAAIRSTIEDAFGKAIPLGDFLQNTSPSSLIA